MARIAMAVSNRYDPDPRVHKQARSLAAAGHEVVVLAFDRQGELAADEELRDGVRIVRLRSRRAGYGGALSVWLGLRAFLAEARAWIDAWKPDVVHCHDQDTCPLGAAWKRAGRGRFVFDAHDLYWSWLLQPNPGALWRRAGARVLRRRDDGMARAADLVVTSSAGRGGFPGFDDHYRAVTGRPPLVVLNVPAGPSSAGAAPEARPLPSRFTVGYVGTVREPEMFATLIEAQALLAPDERADVRLAGAGRSQADVAVALRDAGQGLGFGVEVSGRFDMDALAELNAACSVQYCVYPTARGNILQGAIATKMFESVLHGRKVIVNAGCVMEAWARGSSWGWAVPAGAADALAGALRAARKDLEPLAGCAPSALAAPPTWEQQAAGLIAAYEALL